MIHIMTGGGFKVITPEGKYLGAYNNLDLATAVDKAGRALTAEEFDNLFGVTHEEINQKAERIPEGL